MIGAYIRVSTTSQNHAGQRRELERWMIGNGHDPAEARWYEDTESGDTLARPGFEAMQAAIFAGQLETVVVWKLDRLSRKLIDGLQILTDWTSSGLRVVSVTQQIDLTGTVGRMIAAVLLGIGEMEQETRRERQAIGIDAAKARGAYTGRQPGTTKATPARAAELRAQGLTLPEIGNALNVSRATVSRYLRSARTAEA